MDYFPENHSVHGRKNDLEVDNFLEHGSVFLGNEGRANTETILHRDEISSPSCGTQGRTLSQTEDREF
jgi:hypothetical protein